MISDEVVRRLTALVGSSDADADLPTPGDTFADRFDLSARAGAGGMGVVYRAIDRDTGRTVALKVMHVHHAPEQDDRGELDERFAREAAALAEIDHPAVVRYVAHGRTASGRGWLAMEWLEGEDLRERLARARPSVAESIVLARRVAQGLAAAHERGVVHRDVKPRNLFLPGGAIAQVKLLDFGIARVPWSVAELTRAGHAVGTWGYMAPEQARGAGAIDARADLFSLGCVLFECLTGAPPFAADVTAAVLAKLVLEEAPPLADLLPEAPPALHSLLARLLAKDPSARPASGAELVAELDAIDLVDLGPTVPSGRPSVLGSGERRLVCVVLVRAPPGGRDDPTTPQGSARKHPLGTLRSTAEAHGASFDRLADGSLVATIGGAGGTGGATAATDRASRAARCALALRALLPRRAVSLATGRGERSNRLPVGDAIDRAAILRGAAEGVRIDEVTAGLLDSGFEVGGDATGLVLLGERTRADPVRTLLGKPTPFVGRSQEIATLEAALAASIEERAARAVLVTGPPGAGKSRLRSELCLRIRASGGAEPWLGRADPTGAGTPFGPLAQMVRVLAGLREGEPHDVRRRKLRGRVARHVATADQARIAEILGELCGLSAAVEDAARLGARGDPLAIGEAIRQGFEDFLSAESDAAPVVILLEDLQWGDRPTVDLVDRLLRNLARPIVFVAFARPEVHDGFPALWAERAVTELRLGRLPPRASETLARAVLGKDVEDARVRRLVERADGNAFFLEELLRTAAEGRWEDSPGTVVAMVQSRLEALEPEARKVLRAASVFGGIVDAAAVTALAGGGAEADRWLPILAEREILTVVREGRPAGEAGFAFRHAFVRDAAYAMLTDEDRRLGHRLAGEWLGARGDADPLVLAEHLEAGGEPARAAPFFLRAARLALDRNDFEGAIRRAERSVQAGIEREALGEARLVQAQAHRWLGESRAAMQRAAEAVDRLASDSEPSFVALGEMGLSARYLRDAAAVAHAVDRLLAATPPPGTESALVLALLLTGSSLWTGETDARLVERAERIAADPETLRPDVRARFHGARALGALRTGHLVRVVEEHGAAVRANEEAGERRAKCVSRVNEACALSMLGRYEAAEEILRETIGESDRLGLVAIKGSACESLVAALLGRDAREEARRVAADAVAAAEPRDPRAHALARARLAQVLSSCGEIEAAAREAARAVELVTVEAGTVFVVALACQARAHLAAGRASAARDLATRIDALVPSVPLLEFESLVHLVCAEAHHAAGDAATARAAIAAARDRIHFLAERIPDAEWRATFLDRVPENARTLALAAEWLGPSA